MTKSCNTCKWALFVDHGYSNYTVEGTTFHCQLNKHPDCPFDRWYGEEARLEHAEKCPDYEHGNPIELDVDNEDGNHDPDRMYKDGEIDIIQYMYIKQTKDWPNV